MTSLDARSLQQSRDLASALRRAPKTLQDGLRRGLTAAVAPVEDEVKASARRVLPSGGGMGDWVAARVDVSPKVATSSDRVTVTVTISMRGHDLSAINRGRIMHPVYGRLPMRGPQLVKPGFVTDALKGPVADRARREMDRVLEDTARQIAKESG